MNPQDDESPTQPPVSSSDDDPTQADSALPAHDQGAAAPDADGPTITPRPARLDGSIGALVAWERMIGRAVFGSGIADMLRPRALEAFKVPLAFKREVGYFSKASATGALAQRHTAMAKLAMGPSIAKIAGGAGVRVRSAAFGSDVERWRRLTEAGVSPQLGGVLAAMVGLKGLETAWGDSFKLAMAPFSVKVADMAAVHFRETVLGDAAARTTALRLAQAVAAYQTGEWDEPRPAQAWDRWTPGGTIPQPTADPISALDSAAASPIQPESLVTLECDLRLRLAQLGIMLAVTGSLVSTIAGIRLLILAEESLTTIVGVILGELAAVLAYPSFIEAKRRLVSKT